MSWFFKKKVVTPGVTSPESQLITMITTNPPAREITLFKRKEKLNQKIESSYKDLIEAINRKINEGVFELTTRSDGYRSNKYTIPESTVISYLAARKLRKNGFKVKFKVDKTEFNNMTGIREPLVKTIICYFHYINISWK